MKVFWNESQRAHDPKFFMLRGVIGRNFELAARADALLSACDAMGMVKESPASASLSAVLQVHTPDYIEFLEHAYRRWTEVPGTGRELVPNHHIAPEMVANGGRCPTNLFGQLGFYTSDTSMPIGAGSYEAAIASAGCAIAAADEAARGRSSYALCRPPGHHAYAARASGHCILNNAAIAAERLRSQGAARVGIIDIDCHHGNGTQGLFWEREDVVTVSVHGDPNDCYPWFVGHTSERGAGLGEGFNINLPLKRAAVDSDWLEALEHGLHALADCDALVVALGMDASKDEPLGFMAVTEQGFEQAGRAIGRRRKPCAIVQEGGYNVDVLGTLLTRFINGFQG